MKLALVYEISQHPAKIQVRGDSRALRMARCPSDFFQDLLHVSLGHLGTESKVSLSMRDLCLSRRMATVMDTVSHIFGPMIHPVNCRLLRTRIVKVQHQALALKVWECRSTDEVEVIFFVSVVQIECRVRPALRPNTYWCPGNPTAPRNKIVSQLRIRPQAGSLTLQMDSTKNPLLSSGVRVDISHIPQGHLCFLQAAAPSALPSQPHPGAEIADKVSSHQFEEREDEDEESESENDDTGGASID